MYLIVNKLCTDPSDCQSRLKVSSKTDLFTVREKTIDYQQNRKKLIN